MAEFQRLVYSVCEGDAEEIYRIFLQNEIHLMYDYLILKICGNSKQSGFYALEVNWLQEEKIQITLRRHQFEFLKM